MSGKDDYDVIANALEHLAKVLDGLQNDDEVKIGNGIISKDLGTNATNASELARKLRVNPGFHLTGNNLALTCIALRRYVTDLRASKKALLLKLFGKEDDFAGFETEKLDEEITHADKALNYYCKMK